MGSELRSFTVGDGKSERIQINILKQCFALSEQNRDGRKVQGVYQASLQILPHRRDATSDAVCDPSKHAIGYRDWGKDDLLNQLWTVLEKPEWRSGTEGTVPGGRDVDQNFVDTYYAADQPGSAFKGCSSYADFRELLDKEKDLDAVKIMTPDHLHGVISIACMKRGKHVIMHKPAWLWKR